MIKGMYNKLPQSITIDDERYFINTDFRIFIEFEKEMLEGNSNEATKIALYSFAPSFFDKEQSQEKIEKFLDKFIWFYKCGKVAIDNQYSFGKNAKTNSRIFDYEYDSDLIWGAYHDRGYDLTKDYIHWWKFKALWNSMPKECEFNKVKGYRAYDGKDKDILELKEAYKLPPTKAEIEDQIRRDKLYEQLK